MAGRCATTAIKLAFKVDPATEMYRRLLRAFIRWSLDATVSRASLRIAWRIAYARVVPDESKPPLFRHVTGPLTAIIASVACLGWFPRTLEMWESPHGVKWCVVAANWDKLAGVLTAEVELLLWKMRRSSGRVKGWRRAALRKAPSYYLRS